VRDGRLRGFHSTQCTAAVFPRPPAARATATNCAGRGPRRGRPTDVGTAERRRTQTRRHEFPCRTLLVRTIGYSNHMSGIGDRAEAEGTELKGKAKEAAGRAAGDPGLRARGEVDQARGKSKGLIGRIKTFLARR
jgi:uncharacterized protein YjbJ (UPF0337 family)